MNKLVLLLTMVIIMIPLCIDAQIVKQPGIVREQTYEPSAKQIPIADVRIKVNTEFRSGDDGSFLLSIPDNDQDVFSFDYISKNGYMLIAPSQDEMARHCYPLNKNALIVIVMARRDDYQKEQRRIENNIRNKTEKELDVLQSKIDSLMSLTNDGKQQIQLEQQIDSLENSLNELQEKYWKSDVFIAEEAARLAKIDYSTLDSIEVIKTNLMKAGDGYGAVALVQSQISPEILAQIKENPALLTQDIAQAEQTIENKKRQREKIADHLFDIASGYALEMRYDSAYYYTHLSANTDTTNLDNLRKCARFLLDQNQMYEALHLYGIVLRNIRKSANDYPDTYNPDLADILNNKGLLYTNLGKYYEAEQDYLECLDLRRTLVAKNPDAYNSDLAAILNNLGILYKNLGLFPEAEQFYSECLTIRRDLAAKNPDVHNPDLADILNNLGLLHSNLGQFSEAEKEYSECLTIRRSLAADNPDAYNSDLAAILNNLGVLHSNQRRYLDAEKDYSESLYLYRDLAAKNPDAHSSFLATILNNLGILYSNLELFPMSEQNYSESLNLYRDLAIKNPDAYNPYLAYLLKNLGTLHHRLGRYSKAEQEYSESLSIRRALAVNNPDAYNSGLADFLNTIALFYARQKEYTKALSFIYEAIALFPENPNYYDSKGRILMMKGDKEAATKAYNEKPKTQSR